MKSNSTLKLILFPLILCLAFVLNGCKNEDGEETKKSNQPAKDTIIIGIESDILGFYPDIRTYEDITMSINGNIFNALVKVESSSNKIIPDLAEHWDNPNEMTWRFYLKKGVKFHNGDTLTANDVKYTFDYIMGQEEHHLKELLNPIDRVEFIDDHTVDIVTKEPNPTLLTNLFDFYIASEDYIKTNPEPNKPIGTGAYKLVEYTKDDHITLERFGGYHGGKLPIKEAVIRIITDAEERTNALLSGEVDVAKNLPPNRYEGLKKKKSISLKLIPTTRVIFLSFDFRENESYAFPDGKNPTADVRVRRAMYHAINEESIIKEVMSGLAEPATQFVTSQIFGYNPKITRLPYDLDKAKALMKEAGLENGFEIEFDCPNNRYVNDESICQRITENLADINITANLNAQPKSEFFPKVLGRKTSFHLIGWSIDTGDAWQMFNYFLRTVDEENEVGVSNLGYYSNPELDELVEKNAHLMDMEGRLDVMQRGFKMAMDDVVWIPLHIQEIIIGTTNDLKWESNRATIRIEEMAF